VKPAVPLLLLLLAAGCSNRDAVPAAEPQSPAPSSSNRPAVAIIQPRKETLQMVIEQPGEVRGDEETAIHAHISGYVKRVKKDIGDRVGENEIIAELAVPEMDEELNRKTALVAEAQAGKTHAEKQLKAAEAAVSSAAALVREAEAGRGRAKAELRRAESQLDRLQKSSGAVPQEVLEETRLAVESARAVVAEVEAKVKSATAAAAEAKAKEGRAKAEVEVADARVKVAHADERRQAALVEYSRLKAPFPGIITARYTDPGRYVQPPAGEGSKPVFVISRRDKVRVVVEVPEASAVWVIPGTKAEVRLPGLPGRTFHAIVNRISWGLDPRARILRAEIDLPNPDDRLRAGMYAQAKLTIVHKGVWTVEASALRTQGDQVFCFREFDGKAVRTPIFVGLRQGERVEVIERPPPPPASPEAPCEPFDGKERILANPPEP